MNSILRKMLLHVCMSALASNAMAAPLGSSVRRAIPAEVRQTLSWTIAR